MNLSVPKLMISSIPVPGDEYMLPGHNVDSLKRCVIGSELIQTHTHLFSRDNVVTDLICYCFEYSAADIRKDYLENGRSTLMERIQMEKKFGNCQCGTKNPKGK